MIECPVCHSGNDDLLTVCTNCGSFIQAKVDALDLFSTLWGLIESPSATMKRIAIAKQKNYVVLLTAMFGIACSYSFAWMINLGVRVNGFATVIGIGLVAGPFVGLLLTFILVVVIRFVSARFGGISTFRQSWAVFAYSVFPIVASLVLLMPIEVGVFGKYLFDPNPAPRILNPTVWYALAALDGCCVLWAVGLLVVGIRVAHRLTTFRAALVSLATILIAGGGILGLRMV
jgi:hypothetical protein